MSDFLERHYRDVVGFAYLVFVYPILTNATHFERDAPMSGWISAVLLTFGVVGIAANLLKLWALDARIETKEDEEVASAPVARFLAGWIVLPLLVVVPLVAGLGRVTHDTHRLVRYIRDVTRHSSRCGIAIVTLALAVGGCGDGTSQDAPADAGDPADVDVPDDTVHPAVSAFWEAFHDERYDQIPVVQAGLEAALEDEPDDAYVTLVLALAHLWTVAEWERDPSRSPPVRGQHAVEAQGLFARAWELNPADDRIARWLGALKVRQGRVLGDQEMIDDGWVTLELGIEADPQLTFFARALVLSDLAPGSPEVTEAARIIVDNVDACPGPRSSSSRPTCAGTDKIPHRPEGFWLTAGDILAKSGDLETARSYYETATEFDSYATWRFRDLAEDRLTNVEARLAAYANGDPLDDPPTVNRTSRACTICHAD